MNTTNIILLILGMAALIGGIFIPGTKGWIILAIGAIIMIIGGILHDKEKDET